VSAGGRLALAQGAVIEVAGGWVGVDEACAGLRSLDAAVMMAWFIGEQRRFGWRGRLGLGLAALAAAVGGNFIRATTLVWVAAGAGPQATEAWHDTMGWVVLGLTLIGVLGAAEWIGRRAEQAAAFRWAGAPGGGRFVAAGLVLATAGWAATVAWYWPSGYTVGRVGWTLAAKGAEWGGAPPPAGLDTLLVATRWEGVAGAGEGWRGLAYLIAWEGDVAAAENAFHHGPEICLPYLGLRKQAEIGAVNVDAGGKRLVLAGSRYADAAGRPQYVWFARWDEAEGRSLGHGPSASPVETRLAGVMARRSSAVLAQMVLVVAGPADDDAALRWAEAWAPRLFDRTD